MLVGVGHINAATSNNAINDGADDTQKQPSAHAPGGEQYGGEQHSHRRGEGYGELAALRVSEGGWHHFLGYINRRWREPWWNGTGHPRDFLADQSWVRHNCPPTRQAAPMPDNVFISYRREDTAGYAGRLYDRLKAAFPGRVFIDVGEIPPGTDFAKAIEKHIEGCAALIALIGKNWSASDRLQDPEDFVRLEIAGALKRDISVIPVLVGGAELPNAATLPEDIQPLLRRQKISISDEDWEGGCERLVRSLQTVLGPPRKPSNSALRWGLALSVAVVLALAVVWFWKSRMAGPAPTTSHAPPTTMPEATRAATDYDKSVAKGYENAAKKMGDVANMIGGASNPSPPTITSLSPNSGPPGTAVTITGTNFGANQDKSVVTIGSGPAVVNSWSSNSIVVLIPTIKSRRVPVVVSVGGVDSAPADFTVVSNP